jgi:hypothetical protein
MDLCERQEFRHVLGVNGQYRPGCTLCVFAASISRATINSAWHFGQRMAVPLG